MTLPLIKLSQQQARKWLRSIPWRTLGPWLAMGAAIAPMLLLHGINLWRQPQYQVFPLLYLVLGGLMYQEVRFRDGSTERRRVLAAVILSASALLFVTSVAIYSPYVGQVAGILWLLGGLVRYARSVSLGRIATYGALLGLTIIPQGVSLRLAQNLQTVTSGLGSGVLETLRVPHIRQGNLVEVGGRTLFVDEACSGIQSLFAAACVVVIIAVVQKSPLVITLLALASVPFWALVGNLVRIVAVAVSQAWWQFDLAQGWQHDLVGYVNFGFIAVLLCAWVKLLITLLGPIPLAAESHPPGIDLYNHWVQWPNRRVDLYQPYLHAQESLADHSPAPAQPIASGGWKAALPRAHVSLHWAVAAGLLALGLLNIAYMVGHEETLFGRSGERTFDFSVRNSLPGEAAFAGLGAIWPLVKYEVVERDTGSIFGNFSHFWRVSPPHAFSCVASLDFPFLEYHDLSWCYQGTGWSIDANRPVVLGGETVGQIGEGGELELSRQDGGYHGYVVFVLMDELGRVVDSPRSLSLGSQIVRHFREGPIPYLLSGFGSSVRSHGSLLQFQLFCEKETPFTPEEREAIRRQFVVAFSEASEQTAAAFQERSTEHR